MNNERSLNEWPFFWSMDGPTPVGLRLNGFRR